MYDPVEVVYVDARSFDGNPYEVADQAGAQAIALLEILQKSVEVAELMARNSELERHLNGDTTKMCVWENNHQHVLWLEVQNHLSNLHKKLETLRRASTWDPKHPPKLTD